MLGGLPSKPRFCEGLYPRTSHRGLYPRTSHRGLCPQVTDDFGLNPPSQLVPGYHWLAILNQVRKDLFGLQFSVNHC